MTTNPNFNLYFNAAEQTLLDNLTVEVIQMYGQDIEYLPRNDGNIDPLFFEDPTSDFSTAITQEAYILDIEGFSGDAEFLSKFSIEMHDQMKFAIPRTTFATQVGTPASISRPREGDLIWFPIPGALFKITFVEHEIPFYQLGALQFWTLTLELFEYSSERFNTGIPAIDTIEDALTLDVTQFQFLQEDGSVLLQESGDPLVLEEFDLKIQDPLSQNEYLETQADLIIDFSETDPFSEGPF